jgi:hypothetical protein
MTVGVGPLGRFYCFDVVPASSGTTTGQNQIATTQTPTGVNAVMTLTAGTGTTSGTDGEGATIIILDCARTVAFYSASDISNRTITVVGYDQYGQAMSQAITGPNNTTVQTTKCFKSVKSITFSNTAAGACVAGLGTGIGLPYRLTDLGYVASVMYNQTAIAITSTLCKVADTTDPATTTTTDVRGYIIVGQTDNAKRLLVNYSLPALAVGPNATRVGAFGVTQA